MAASKKSCGSSKQLVAAVLLMTGVIIGSVIWCTYDRRTTPVCTASDLKLKAGEQEGAAGTTYQHMVVTNNSGKTCKVTGYPAAFLLDKDSYAIGNGAAPSVTTAPELVKLDDGESAYTVLGYPNASNFDPGMCTDKSVELKIYTPGATSSLTTDLSVEWCPGFSATAFRAGS